MSKYKNKDGIELNYNGKDSHSELVREVIKEAVKIIRQSGQDNIIVAGDLEI